MRFACNDYLYSWFFVVNGALSRRPRCDIENVSISLFNLGKGDEPNPLPEFRDMRKNFFFDPASESFRAARDDEHVNRQVEIAANVTLDLRAGAQFDFRGDPNAGADAKHITA